MAKSPSGNPKPKRVVGPRKLFVLYSLIQNDKGETVLGDLNITSKADVALAHVENGGKYKTIIQERKPRNAPAAAAA